MGENILKLARSYLGVRQGDKQHQELIARYNAVRPVPVGYLMKATDDWCAAFVTVIGDLVGGAKYIGRECGVQRFVHIFKAKKTWLGLVKPRPGDIVVFDWQKNGWADHIGFVETVNGNQISVIEGNSSKQVVRKTYVYNDWRIAGYARPKYPVGSGVGKSVSAMAQEVLRGQWGNGAERERRLSAAGYDAAVVQKEVNRLVRSGGQLKANEAIAKEVVQGKWGNGDARKKRLEKAGYNYAAVQKIVNQIV